MTEMVEWLDLAKKLDGKCTVADLDPSENTSWVKYGFVLAFMFLLVKNITFEKAIKDTIVLGGDTNTNAAIVGGMIGAVVGIKGLPEDLVKKIEDCN
jgi:ADP-ribosyl-[dinitrogen reductase] hydrolase